MLRTICFPCWREINFYLTFLFLLTTSCFVFRNSGLVFPCPLLYKQDQLPNSPTDQSFRQNLVVTTLFVMHTINTFERSAQVIIDSSCTQMSVGTNFATSQQTFFISDGRAVHKFLQLPKRTCQNLPSSSQQWWAQCKRSCLPVRCLCNHRQSTVCCQTRRLRRGKNDP